MTTSFYYAKTNLSRMHSWQSGGDLYDDDDDDENNENDEDVDNDDNHNDNDMIWKYNIGNDDDDT